MILTTGCASYISSKLASKSKKTEIRKIKKYLNSYEVFYLDLENA